MKSKVVLSDAAIKEIDGSYNWYEDREDGLGERFIETIEKAINIISINPAAFPNKKNTFRDMVIDTFPFIIVYEYLEKDNAISVLHVFHASRNPKGKYKKK